MVSGRKNKWPGQIGGDLAPSAMRKLDSGGAMPHRNVDAKLDMTSQREDGPCASSESAHRLGEQAAPDRKK